MTKSDCQKLLQNFVVKNIILACCNFYDNQEVGFGKRDSLELAGAPLPLAPL